MNISIPIKILTPKIPNKQNSVFYAGKNIAEVKILNRTYVLTTAGQYRFSLGKRSVIFDSDDPLMQRAANDIVSKLTDSKIKAMDENIQNWGWFGINVWETRLEPEFHGKPQLLPFCFNSYAEYDEALKAFKEEVLLNLTGKNS